MSMQMVRVIAQTVRMPAEVVRVAVQTVRTPMQTVRVPIQMVRMLNLTVRVPMQTLIPTTRIDWYKQGGECILWAWPDPEQN